jgi:hypothetical protein
MKRFAIHTLAAACMAAVVGPALADASSSARFGNVVITLTDLDTNDGIAPTLAFQLNGPSFIDSRAEGYGDVAEAYQFQNYAPHQGGLFTGDTHTAWSSATGTIMTANNVAGYTSLSAQGEARSGLDAYGWYHAGSIGATPENTFTLSANTMVTFSVMADLHASTTIGYNNVLDMSEYASAHVLLNTGGMVNGEFVTDAQDRYLDTGFEIPHGVTSSWSGLLSASFANTSTSEASGFLQTFAIVEGNSAVTPVPEPGTYAMLLGGLAVLGMTRRRRRT